MVYAVGEDSLCGGLSVCLRGWHAGKTIYTNGGGDAGHCRGADAWRSATTCSRRGEGGDTEGTVSAVFFHKTLKESLTLTGQLENVSGAGPVGQ